MASIPNCDNPRNWGKAARLILSALAVLTLLGGASGCTRKFYRTRADKEVEQVLAQKDRFPFWKIEEFHVYPDPRARFADGTKPDRPPMPPDDPATAAITPHPQKPGKAGIALVQGNGYLELLTQWDAQNRQEDAHHSAAGTGFDLVWRAGRAKQQKTGALQLVQYPPKDNAEPPAQQAFKLKLEQAVELGLINSRDFQDRREDLYLAALPVTLERFSFAAQFFATELAIREWAGRDSVVGQQNRWSFGTTAGVAKYFSTGGLLLLRFANQTVINLSGSVNRHTISVSTLDLDIIQPFLRGGGKAVALEPLTQSERNLVYTIRDYARYRKEFFVSIAAGVQPTATILPPALSLRLTAADALPVTIPGTAIGAALQTRAGASGRLNLTAAGDATSEGYLNALLRAGLLHNEVKNVAALERSLKLFEGFKEGGDVSPLQVDQVKLQLLQGQSTVLQRTQDLRDSLDRLKLQLGLPVDLLLELDDNPLQTIVKHLNRYEKVQSDFEAIAVKAAKLDDMTKPAALRLRLLELALKDPATRGTQFTEQFPKRWNSWQVLQEKAFDERMEKFSTERRKLQDKKDDYEAKEKAFPAADQRRLYELELELDLGNLEKQLRRYEAEPWKAQPTDAKKRAAHATLFRELLNGFVLVVGEARNERLEQLRQTWPPVPAVPVGGLDLLHADLELAQQTVIQTALENRLDLMNIRAQLVDAWRQIAVYANSLLGVFTVGYHMDTSTPFDAAKPLTLGGSRSRHQLILNAELPFVRVQERNNYRAALIAFQRQRRAVMAAEDNVAAAVRTEIRQLRLLAENYKIQQQAVDLAYSQVENSLETFRAPPDPNKLRGDPGSAAALTQQLLTAQRNLPQVQNQLYTIWLNYQITRLQLFLDLEMMPLDTRGVWLDEYRNPDGARSAEPGPDALRLELPAPRPAPNPGAAPPPQ